MDYYLIWINLIAWLIPLLFLTGFSKNYVSIISVIFSGSYWVSAMFIDFDSMPGNIYPAFINDSLVYSVIAALSFYAGFFLFYREIKIKNKSFYRNIDFRVAPGILGYKPIFSLLAGLNTLFILILSIQDIGVGDRIFFLEFVRPFWYFYLIPINSILIAIWVYLDISLTSKQRILGDWFLWLTIVLHTTAVGFDGSRRQAVIPILFIGLKIGWFNLKNFNSLFYLNLKSCMLLLIVGYSVFLGLNRAFIVGWGIFGLSIYELYGYLPVYIEMLIAPSPTISVNTMMLDLVDKSGIHGPENYARAVGNLLFPKFIFRSYLFGEPLVVKMHEDFGWYGQDFGFMAEAIYSGGLIGVVISHALYGSYVAKLLKSAFGSQSSIFFKILLFTTLYGAINSFRSDFMNLLKSTFYPAIGLWVLYKIITETKKIKIFKNVWNHRVGR